MYSSWGRLVGWRSGAGRSPPRPTYKPPYTPPVRRAGPGSWSYRQVGYCSRRLLKCPGHKGDSMSHWSRLGGSSRDRQGGWLPFLCARGVRVLPLLSPISRETGARDGHEAGARGAGQGFQPFSWKKKKTKIYKSKATNASDTTTV